LASSEGGLERGETQRVVEEDAHGICLGSKAEVDVAVDEPRQKGQPVEAEDGPDRHPRGRHDVGDPVSGDDDGTARLRGRAGPVDHSRAHQNQPVIHRCLPSGFGVR
jgi:hypothetical protein